MAKKVSRKQLLKEPDQFLTFSSRMLNFAGQYRNRILWGTVSFFGLIIAIALVNFISSRAETRAFALLDQATGRYEAALAKDGPEKALEAASGDFQKLFDDYTSQAGGQMARVVFADACFRGGNIDRAVSLYTDALVDYADQPFYLNRIRASLALALVQKKDFKTAAEQFEQVVQGGRGMTDEALFHLGMLYARMGEADKSRRSFDKIVAEHADSIYLELAKAGAKG
ncbi:MAG: tetratricopeptide repeat protein [Desulfobacterales bacterium]|nr:tetratricopeptide repeat protein [Desulfobacterales bacterium]